MTLRRSSIVIAGLGAVLVAASAVTYFGIAPSLSKLPGNLDITAQSSGTGRFLDPAALQSGDLANLFLDNVPINAEQHVYVSQTIDDTAIVHSDLEVVGPNSMTITSSHTFAVNRSTMEAADAPTVSDVEPHRGIVAGLPPNPDSGDSYELFDPSTGQSFPLNSSGTTRSVVVMCSCTRPMSRAH